MNIIYRRLFDPPGAVGFVTAGFVARLTVSMSGLGLVLALTADTHRGYAIAGLVAGVFGLASSLMSPYVGRLVDAHGQRRVLVPLVAVFTAGVLAMIAAIAVDAPSAALLPLAVLSGASMPVCGPLIRTRWATLYGGTPMLRVSYAFESVTDEIVYIVGPVVVAAVAVTLGASVGLLAMVVCAVVGTLALAAQTGTQPRPHGHRAAGGHWLAPLTGNGPLLVVCAALFGIGSALGALEIITVAYAEARGHKGASGALLGLMGAASMIAGLAFGAARIRLDPARRLGVTVTAFGLGLLPLWLVDGLAVLAVLLFCAGLVLAPAMISCMEIVAQVVDRSVLTEAMTWASAAIGLGLTAGTLVGGVLADSFAPEAAFRVPAAFGIAAAFVVVAAHRSTARTMQDHGIAS